mmetsp:Transcript_7981/g.17547  ORF Transcript_7981/g.17547 Transcript_7981/m.17547 type:complete len:153 (-) Transcript_7981:23-481(-)
MLMFAFYKWNGPVSNKEPISHVIKSYGCCRQFVWDMFDPMISTLSVNSMHLRYLHQISGPSLSGWNVSIKVISTGTKDLFYETGETPDSWLNSYLLPPCFKKTLICLTPSKMHPQCIIPPKRRSCAMRDFEMSTPIQWKNSTVHLLVCKKNH